MERLNQMQAEINHKDQ
jgi:hypothetical protein